MNSFDDSVVTITGGTGSFGSTMAVNLLDKGVRQINIFSRDEAKQDEMRRRFNDERLRFFLGDVRDAASVAPAVRGADYVFHAAALKQVPSCEFFPQQAVMLRAVITSLRPLLRLGYVHLFASVLTRPCIQLTQWACRRR